MNLTEQQEVTREGLKIMALRDRVSQLEDEAADMRVDYTVLLQEYTRLKETYEPDVAEEKPEDDAS